MSDCAMAIEAAKQWGPAAGLHFSAVAHSTTPPQSKNGVNTVIKEALFLAW